MKWLSWVKHHFQHLKRWREYAEKIAKAVKDLFPSAEAYVVGGVAEDRVTIYSDIDVLVIVKDRILNSDIKKNLVVEIVSKAIERYDLPWDAPVEIHIVDDNTFKEYSKYYRKMVRIEPR